MALIYYSGQLKIPNACQGSNLLLALEYFGILYAPGQVVFSSHQLLDASHQFGGLDCQSNTTCTKTIDYGLFFIITGGPLFWNRPTGARNHS
jgi:hypothetical protein